MTEYVYFLTYENGPIKIGRAKNVPKRIKALQTAVPFKLKLLGVIIGGPSVEIAIHNKFSHLKLKGEWFQNDSSILEYLDQQVSRTRALVSKESDKALSSLDEQAQEKIKNQVNRRKPTSDPEIIQYKNGGYYFFGVPPGGNKRIERSLKTKDFQEAKRLKFELQKELQGIRSLRVSNKFSDIAEIYIQKRKDGEASRGNEPLRPRTIFEDEYVLRGFMIPFFKDKRITDIDEDLFSKYRKHYGERDYRNHRKVLVSLLKWCYYRKTINFVPRFPLSKRIKRKRLVLTEQEIVNLLSKAHGRLLLYISMYLFMGMRRSEIIFLEWDRVDFINRSIFLSEEHTKTKRARNIPINRFVLNQLIAQKNIAKNQWVFPNRKSNKNADKPMSVDGFKKPWERLLLSAGITREITPHDLRATYETYAHKSTEFTDTQREKMAGASIDVQKKIYVDMSANDLRGLENVVQFKDLNLLMEKKDSGSQDGNSTL